MVHYRHSTHLLVHGSTLGFVLNPNNVHETLRHNYIHFTDKNEAQRLSQKVIQVSAEGYNDQVAFRMQIISSFR